MPKMWNLNGGKQNKYIHCRLGKKKTQIYSHTQTHTQTHTHMHTHTHTHTHTQTHTHTHTRTHAHTHAHTHMHAWKHTNTSRCSCKQTNLNKQERKELTLGFSGSGPGRTRAWSQQRIQRKHWSSQEDGTVPAGTNKQKFVEQQQQNNQKH